MALVVSIPMCFRLTAESVKDAGIYCAYYVEVIEIVVFGYRVI